MKKELAEYKERFIRLQNIYKITTKKNKLLMEERERRNLLIDRQAEEIRLLKKKVKEYEKRINKGSDKE